MLNEYTINMHLIMNLIKLIDVMSYVCFLHILFQIKLREYFIATGTSIWLYEYKNKGL